MATGNREPEIPCQRTSAQGGFQCPVFHRPPFSTAGIYRAVAADREPFRSPHVPGVRQVVYDRTQDLDSFVYKQNLSFGELYEWGFFKIRGYKKGTMHFEFIDEDLWYKFNSMVAKSRGWELPQNTGKKKKQ